MLGPVIPNFAHRCRGDKEWGRGGGEGGGRGGGGEGGGVFRVWGLVFRV